MSDLFEERRERIVELLAPGTTILAIGETEATCLGTGGKLFRDFEGSTRNMVVAVTSAGIVLMPHSFDGGFGAGNFHYATDAIPWGAIQKLIEPTALIQGDRKGLNIILGEGVLVQTACFPGKPGDAQTHFHAQGASIAIQAWQQALAAGAPRSEPVTLGRAKFPSEPSVLDFVRFVVTPRLRAGEAIELCGAVTTHDVDALVAGATPATGPAPLLVVGTSQRLLLVRTTLSALGTPCAENAGVASIELAQIHWQPDVAQACRGGTPYVRFLLDSTTQVTLDFATPRPDVPGDAGFRQGFSQWLVARTSSAPPPVAPGPGPTRRAAETWPNNVDARRVAILHGVHQRRAVDAGSSSPALPIAMLALAGLAGLAAAYEGLSFLTGMIHGIPMPTFACCSLFAAGISIGLGYGGWTRLEKRRAAKQALEGGVPSSTEPQSRRVLIGALAVLGMVCGLCCLVSLGSRMLGGGGGPESVVGIPAIITAATAAGVCDGRPLAGAGPVTSNPTLLVFTTSPVDAPVAHPELSQPPPLTLPTFTYAVCMAGPTPDPVASPRPGCTELSHWDVRVVRAATGQVVATGTMRQAPNAQCAAGSTEGDYHGTPTASDIHDWVHAHAPLR